MTTDTTTLLTAEEVAAKLKVKPRTVAETWQRKGCTNGFPKPLRVGARKRWRLEDIDAWVEQKRMETV